MTAVAAVATVGVVMPATPAAAVGTAPAFVCAYRITAWAGGFSADLSMTNNGPTVDGWTARWTFAEPTVILGVWTASLTQTASTVSATNVLWNPVIRTGTTTSFGWTATAQSTSVPTDITVNGQRC